MQYLNGRGNEAAKKLADKMMKNHKANEEVQQALQDKCHTITILARKEPDGRGVYQWGSNNECWFSPPIYDLEEAFRYPSEVGLKLQTAG